MVNLTHNVSYKWYLLAALAQLVINLIVGTVRFVIGWPMDGKEKTNAGWFTTGTRPINAEDTDLSWWCYRPRAVRALIRLVVLAVVLAVGVALLRDWQATVRAGVMLACVAVVVAVWHAVKTRHIRAFRRYYVLPTAKTLAPYLGWPASTPWRRWLTISEDLEGLAPPPSKPLSPAEEWIRTRYGLWVQPVLRWLPERVQKVADYWGDEVPEVEPEVDERSKARRGADLAKTHVKTVFGWFRRPTEEKPPRIELHANTDVFVNAETKAIINEIIEAKLGPGKDLTGSWDQRGNAPVGTWTAVLEPPVKVSYDGVIKIIDSCADHEIYLGQNKSDEPVIVSLDGDSPHIACSAGSGAGKSVLAMIIAIQVLRRGGEVLICDFKATSHPWAVNLPGVKYARKIPEIHDLLIAAEQEGELRNEEGWQQNPYNVDPAAEAEEVGSYNVGPRKFIIFEEMNATIAKLQQYWNDIREPSDPKTSPAIIAFRNLMFMGRSANMNMFGVAQMLTAKTTGGPEARENFGIRCLARYTKNNWRMLVPECAMPRRKSKVRGRWQVVVEGESTEVQVPFTKDLRMVRSIAVPDLVPGRPAMGTPRQDVGRPAGTPASVPAEEVEPVNLEAIYEELMTLPEAIAAGHVLGNYEWAKKKIQRAQKGESGDEPIWPDKEKRGNANLYKVGDLIRFFTPVPTSEEATSNR